MIYVTSDLHGCAPEVLFGLLESAGFSQEDYLFILGDVVDRGEHGVELLRWIAEQPNVELILGNHEAMLLSCDFVFEELTEESLTKLDPEKMELLDTWLSNGALPTVKGLCKLIKSAPEILAGILEFLWDAPLYDVVEISGRTYILVHAGLENFDPKKSLDSYDPRELLWARPTLDTKYFEKATVVFGHTPTGLFGSPGKMVKTDSWICIDTGAAMGKKPMLLRLDDEKAFY